MIFVHMLWKFVTYKFSNVYPEQYYIIILE